LACFNMWRSFRPCRQAKALQTAPPLLVSQAHLHAPAVGVALPAHRVLGCPTEGRCGLTPYSIGTRFEIRAVLRATGQITPTAAGQCINQVLLKRGIIRHARDRATITRACPLAPSAGPSPSPHLSTRSGTDLAGLAAVHSLGRWIFSRTPTPSLPCSPVPVAF
jgi:hypothetical protein